MARALAASLPDTIMVPYMRSIMRSSSLFENFISEPRLSKLLPTFTFSSRSSHSSRASMVVIIFVVLAGYALERASFS